MDELFVKSVTRLGGELQFVPLSKVREDAEVVTFFQRTLMKPLWAEDTLATFFQSRTEEWEFDPKVRGVRIRSKITSQIEEINMKKRKTAPFPGKLYEAVLRAGTLSETVSTVYNASAADLAALPVDTMEALLESLGKTLEANDPLLATGGDVFKAAQAKTLAALPGALYKKGAGLGMILDFYKRVIKFGGDQADPQVAQQRIETLRELCSDAGTAIKEKGLGTVAPGSLGLLCQTAPIHIIATAVAALGEKGEGDDVKACAMLLQRLPVALLEALPAETLIRLASAASRSTSVAEAILPCVVAASAAVLSCWSLDDVSKLLMALAKIKAAESVLASLHGRAAEALFPKLASMSDAHLIKVVMAFSKVSTCREFLEAAAVEVANRLGKTPLAQLLYLTQGLAPLGGSNASVVKLLDFWEKETDEAKDPLTADQLAKLAQIAASLSPSPPSFWAKLGRRLLDNRASLTEVGKASLQSTFANGAGPDFPDKEALLAAFKPKEAPKEKEKDRNKEKDKDREREKDRDRDRDRDREKDRDKDRKERDNGRDDRRDDRRDERRADERKERSGRERDRSRDRDRKRSRSRDRRR